MESQEYRLLFAAEETHWWFLAKRQYLKKVLPIPKRSLRILDAGAGTGGTSQFLEQWGNVTRIESSPVAAEFLKRRGLSFIRQDLNTYKFPKAAYDIITCLDVLYHTDIKNDETLIQNFYYALKPGGLLVITDCAVPQLMSRHDTRNHARVRYTLSDVTKKIKTSGFTIQKATYTYFFVFPLTVLSRVLEKFSDRSDVSIPPRIINALLWHICLWESYILKVISLPIGSSLLVVARKPDNRS